MKRTLVAALQYASSARFQRLGTEFFWIALGNAAVVLGSLAGIRVLTEYLDPVEYGRLALALTLATFTAQTLTGPLSNGVVRFYAPAQERGDLGSYLSVVRRFAFWATSIVVVTTVVGAGWLLQQGHGALALLVAAAAPFAVITGYSAILNGMQNAARQRGIVALHQGMDAWARLGGAAALMSLLGAGSTVALWGYVLAIVPVLLSQLFFFRRTVRGRDRQFGNEAYWSEQIWRYSWPMSVTGVMSWGFMASQRWALEMFATTRDVGYFSAVFQIGYAPISLAGGMLMTLMMPIVFAQAGDGGDKQRVARVSRAIVRLCSFAGAGVVVCTAGGALLHETVFRLLAAEEYRAVSYYLPFAILSAGVLQISLALSAIVLADAQTRRLLPLNTIGNSLVIALTFLGTHQYGMNGLFAAMVLGSFVHLAWAIRNSYKVLSNERGG